MGFIENMAKAKAYDEAVAQKQMMDNDKANQLNKIVEAKRMQDEQARQAALFNQAKSEGMAAALSKIAEFGVPEAPKKVPMMQYNPDVYKDTNTSNNPVQGQGLADILSKGQ